MLNELWSVWCICFPSLWLLLGSALSLRHLHCCWLCTMPPALLLTICTVTEAYALLLTLYCATYIAANSVLRFLASWLLLNFAFITLAYDYIYYHWSILLLNIAGSRSKVLIQEVDLLKNPTHLQHSMATKPSHPTSLLGVCQQTWGSIPPA